MLTKDFVLRIFEGFSIKRWNDLVRPFEFVEMDKAAEKMVIAYIIGKFEEDKGVKIDWKWMIYASLFDLLRKISLCDIKSPVQKMLKHEYWEEFIRLNEWVLESYKNLLDSSLFEKFRIYIGQKSELIAMTEEEKAAEEILDAAHKFATMREYQMLSVVNEPERIQRIGTEILERLQQHMNLTGLQMLMTHQRPYDFIMKIESLRFQVRWNQTPRVPETSVLGHCFFVAILTLLLGRECGEKLCAGREVNNFFSALFHDLPESVTRDIISPVKQATDELPNIVKKIESDVVERELVPLMEPFFADEIMYFISEEFSNKIVIDGKLVTADWEQINSIYNKDEYLPVDGRTVRLADHLSALLEAHISINHGITSKHLVEGRDNILSIYKEGCAINGIDIGKFFREIIS